MPVDATISQQIQQSKPNPTDGKAFQTVIEFPGWPNLSAATDDGASTRKIKIASKAGRPADLTPDNKSREGRQTIAHRASGGNAIRLLRSPGGAGHPAPNLS